MSTDIHAVQRALSFQRNQRRPKLIAISMLLVFTCLIAFNTGAVDANIFRWLFDIHSAGTNVSGLPSMNHTILWEIRAPRILMTMISGAGLAICGAVLQAICRNPLADPGLIGVSSGAALFAALAIAMMSFSNAPAFLGTYFIPLFAFFGAAFALILLLKIASSASGMHTLILILAGVAINTGAMTLLGLINYVVDDATLRQITFWSMGSYSGIAYSQFFIALLPIAAGIVYFWHIRHSLMLISCSEKQAKYQGVETDKIKHRSLWLVAAMVAVCVSFTGIVGFVGLVVPHVCRMFIGAHLRLLIPASALLGALLVTMADTLSRILIIPAELPVGLITSLVGVPFFLYLIVREKRKFGFV